jgi:hypothetical protein
VQLSACGRVTYRKALLSPRERRENGKKISSFLLVPLSPSGREGLGE